MIEFNKFRMSSLLALIVIALLSFMVDSSYALDRAAPLDNSEKKGVFERLLTAQVSIVGCRRVACEEVAKLLNLAKFAKNNSPMQLQLDGNKFSFSAMVSQLGAFGLNNLVVDHPWIEKIETQWKFSMASDAPFSVEVEVHERKPAFVIEMRGESWLVSADGFPVLPLSSVLDTDLILEAGDLPRVSFAIVGDQAFGSGIEKRYAKALSGIRSIDQAGGLPFIADRYEVLADGSLKIAPMELQFPSISLFARNPAGVRSDLQKVNAVLRDLKAKGEQAENIDLRFANQAVVNYGRGGQVPSVVDTN